MTMQQWQADDGWHIDVRGLPPPQPLVGVVMGSDSDWPTMQAAAVMLKEFGVPFEALW